jgi:hypothetical protein
MPYVCTPTSLPAPAVHALPVPPVHHGIGHGFRAHLMRRGWSHANAVITWHCVWVAPALGAGGAAYGVGRWLSGVGGGVAGGALGALGGGAVVAVPEPSTLILALGVAVLAAIHRRK